jgi:hypothetical protein
MECMISKSNGQVEIMCIEYNYKDSILRKYEVTKEIIEALEYLGTR